MLMHETKECRPLGSEQHQAPETGDAVVDAGEAQEACGLTLVSDPEQGAYDVVVVAVGHEQFKALGKKGIHAFGKSASLIYDIKYVLPADASDERL